MRASGDSESSRSESETRPAATTSQQRWADRPHLIEVRLVADTAYLEEGGSG
jgi:hypothetical protein